MDIRSFFGGDSKLKQSSVVNKPLPKENLKPTIENTVTDSVVPPTKESNQTVTSNAKCEIKNSGKTEKVGNVMWGCGENIPYAALVETFELVSNVSGRLEKESLFRDLFQKVIRSNPADLDSIVYLAANSLSPAYEGMELGIGDSLLVKAICEATGRTKAAVDEDYEREGDLGIVALLSRSSQKTLSFAAKPKPLSAAYVLDQLRLISQTKGEKAQSRKVDRIKALMVKCQGCEAKYFVRALQGKLRIGTAAQTILVSLAEAFVQSDSLSSEDTLVEDILDKKAVHETSASTATMSITSDTVEGEAIDKILNEIQEGEPPEAKSLRLYSQGKKLLSKDDIDNLAINAVKRAFSECPNYTLLIQALLKYPIYELYKSCRLIPGVPVQPMLAKPTKEIGAVLQRFSGLAFTMEYKYDGERGQVHLKTDGTVKIFSRNSEDNSEKYPDLRDIIKTAKMEHINSCVIDAEVVAYDRAKGCLLPFQVLSTRKRKMEEGEEEKVRVVLQAFDLLYINGKSLLLLSLRERRQLLRLCFKEVSGLFEYAKGADHVEDGDTAPIEAMMQEACAAMCEGLMVKTLDDNASYEPSKRSLNWLKLKKDYIDGMGVCDSVDLVVIGAYKGRGKRTNVYGAYLVACYDPDRDEFQSCCKLGTGFKDEDLIRLTEQLQPLIITNNRKPHNYNVGDPLYPDDWFQASIVWEVQAADLSKSSVHKAGTGRLQDNGRGIGLRFPRYIRDRPDKKPENCTTSEQIVDMYFSQGDMSAVEGANGGNGEDDEDDLL